MDRVGVGFSATHLISAVWVAKFYHGKGPNPILVIILQPHMSPAFLSFSPLKRWDYPRFNALFSLPAAALVQS